jgi:hypothetical protein
MWRDDVVTHITEWIAPPEAPPRIRLGETLTVKVLNNEQALLIFTPYISAGTVVRIKLEIDSVVGD